ncbi:2-(3-amino-3-carboxypropyl)histidine synthase subunit 2 [Sabethes cyaneus]|uniref:2-(3-amino-3-carboxypropyl)histidine synthase subunit 2 n=1 Tax=Sabethes cyaneus TaxID=53552 RepID=UPI00237D48F6|nr:2-(3-amino-3-carboxypropyl)histidine synthase subunit 2 [Sabethes cyaneus]XP_053698039.1 2-(3-amino-3-carboxypropyl)histidine synthase subunit 2 [Sabethes cyaneus]
MAVAFSSNEAAALERQLESTPEDGQHSVEIANIKSFWNDQVQKQCSDWILTNKYKKVCLQFPDALLPFSTTVAEQLQRAIPEAEFFILGDTSYGSCCVDEIAASHVSADAIVHFGHTCLSRSVRLPTHYVFLRGQLDVDRLVAAFSDKFPDGGTKLAVFYDVSYAYCMDSIGDKLGEHFKCLTMGKLAACEEAKNFLSWKLEELSAENSSCVFIGHDNQSFFNISNSVKAETWFRYDPSTNSLELADPLNSKWLRRRFYYIEKCKDARSLGIVVATLTADGYLDVVNRVQQLAKARGIRTYIISVGKINPAKLANFAEIDCFVLVGCPENNLFTSREFFKPLVSVFECELAFNPAWMGQFPDRYSTNFAEILPSGSLYRPFDPAAVDSEAADVSLVTGMVRNATRSEVEQPETSAGSSSQQLLVRGRNELATVSSGDAFQNRSWQGLEQNLGRDAPAVVVEGRSGIPIKYDNDLNEK